MTMANLGKKSPNNPIPLHQTSPAQISSVDARVIGSFRIIWVGDTYDEGDELVILP